MPQRQRHRGQHPEDGRLFAPAWIPVLRQAVADLSFLLTRGYAQKAALKLVGDHYQLALRQRRAVLLAACPDTAIKRRKQTLASPDNISDIAIDGFNQLIFAETLLSGGMVFRCRDGCIRDLSGVHGSYHRVCETQRAVHQIGINLARLGITHAQWYFDAPVSNSGRVCAMIRKIAASHGWHWEAEPRHHLDAELTKLNTPVATSDSWVLDRAESWVNLSALLLDHAEQPLSVVDLANDGSA